MDTRTLVNQHAWNIVQEGRWPSATELRRRIGGGSMTTISDALSSWATKALLMLVAAKAQSDDPMSDQSLQHDRAIVELTGRLEECRANLQQNYDRFETFENRMFREIEAARSAHLPVIEKAKRELLTERQDREMMEKRYLRQINTLAQRLRAAGLDADY